MLLKVKFLGHEIGYNTIKPIHSKITAIHKIPSPTGKVALMSFIGALNFYTKFIEKLHINPKPFYDLLHENTPWKWTEDHERLFQTLKTSLTSNTELTVPNTKHPFFITVDASLIGLGAVLFQLIKQNQMKVISYNSRILNPQEQKLSTLERDFLGIVHALQIYEFIILDHHILSTFSLTINLFYIVLRKKETLVHAFIEHKCNSPYFRNLKEYILQEKTFLLLTYSVDLLLKKNYKSINSNINTFHLILISQYYKTTNLNPYIT